MYWSNIQRTVLGILGTIEQINNNYFCEADDIDIGNRLFSHWAEIYCMLQNVATFAWDNSIIVNTSIWFKFSINWARASYFYASKIVVMASGMNYTDNMRKHSKENNYTNV